MGEKYLKFIIFYRQWYHGYKIEITKIDLQVLADTLTKFFFFVFLLSEHFKHFLVFIFSQQRSYIFLAYKGPPPIPLKDMSAKFDGSAVRNQ